MDAFLLAAGHVASSSVPRGGLGRQIKFTLPVDEEKSGMVQLRQILLGYSRSRLHLYSCHRRWQSSSPRASMKVQTHTHTQPHTPSLSALSALSTHIH